MSARLRALGLDTSLGQNNSIGSCIRCNTRSFNWGSDM